MRKVSGFAALWTAAVLSVGPISLRSARADDPDPPVVVVSEAAGWVTEVIDALKAEQPGKLGILLKVSDKEDLLAAPAETWRLAQAMAKYVPKWGIGEFHERAELAATWMQKLSADVLKAKPKDPLAQRTGAAAHATKARLDVVRASQVAPDDWVAATQLITASYATDAGKDGGEAAGLGVGWLRDGAALEGMDLSAISSQLDALAKVIDPLPAAKVADLAKAQVRLLRAMLTPAQAKTSMDAFFAIMTPYAKPECDPPIATLYNEGVTFARSKKILVKNDYLKLPPPTGPAYVTYQLLLSERFKSFPGGEDRVLGGFHQYDQYGRTIRDVSIELFRWDKHYAADGKVFGGAEAKGLARLLQGFRKDEFSKITATKDLQKGVFAKGMPPSEFFDMQGVDGGGSPLRVRVHFVKGKEAPVTYALSITDHGKLPDGDPEMKEILDSFVEVPKK